MFTAGIKYNIGNALDGLKRGAVLSVGILEGKAYPDEALDVAETIELDGKKRRTPWLNSQGKERKTTTAEVAFWNEFGTVNMPARPFLRNTLRRKSAEWTWHLKNELGRGQSVPQALEALGEVAVKDIMETIENGVPPANAPLTVAIKRAKGRTAPDHTLVDSAYMQESIGFRVDEK